MGSYLTKDCSPSRNELVEKTQEVNTQQKPDRQGGLRPKPFNTQQKPDRQGGLRPKPLLTRGLLLGSICGGDLSVGQAKPKP
jgi:hypothetical protein